MTQGSPKCSRCRAIIRRFEPTVFLAVGCDGPQSALVTAGRGAAQIATLWWWMAGGALFVWGLMVGLALYALHTEPKEERRAARLILLGGAVFPALVLAALLSLSLSITPGLLARGQSPDLAVEVVGEEWWWRVRYPGPGGSVIETANEIRLPLGRTVEFTLLSADVIHSFWIPSLGGKMDMIPGRVNHLVLEPTRMGEFRGVCAEFCGTSHAWMGLTAIVMEPAAFDTWLAQQAADASPPATAAVRTGRDRFLSNGCGACHAVRGTPARGVIGPDLTHVASRSRLAAGALPNDAPSMMHWLIAPASVKPDARMPAFGMLPDPDLEAIVAWLRTLE